MQFAIGHQVLFPKLLPRAAELPASQNAYRSSRLRALENAFRTPPRLRRKPRKKLRARNPLLPVPHSSRPPRAHHLGRLRQSQIHHRSECRIEAECLHSPRNQLAMFARQRTICDRFLAARSVCALHCRRHRLRRRQSEQAHRAGDLPSRLLHRRSAPLCRAPSPVASSSSARVCVASVMLRLKRMMPPGRTSRSHARSRPVSSVPPSPTTSRLPAACRRVARHPFLLQFLSAALPADSAPAAASAHSHPPPRCDPQSAATSGVKIVICIGSGSCLHLHALPLLLLMLPQHMLCPLDHRRRQSCQLCHFNAVTLARRARLNVVQKNNSARASFTPTRRLRTRGSFSASIVSS